MNLHLNSRFIRRGALLTGAGLFCLSVSMAVRADDSSAPSSKPKVDKGQAAQLAQKLQEEKTLEVQEKQILADQHMETGRQYYKAKNYQQAKSEYQMAVSLNPSLTQTEKLIADCDEGIVRDQHAFVAKKYREGVSLYNARNYQQAIDCFDKVLAADPGNDDAVKYKSKALQAMKALEVGGKAATLVGKEQAEKASALYDEGVRLYNEGNYDAAKDTFEMVVTLNPVHIPARRYLGIINERKNEFVRRDEQLVQEKAIYDVRRAWLPAVRSASSSDSKKKVYKKPEVKTQQQLIMEEKARQIVPEINFTDAHLRDVIKYLSKISGVNIILDEDLFKRTEGLGTGMEAGGAGKAGSATGISEDNFFEEDAKEPGKDGAAGAAKDAAAKPAAPVAAATTAAVPAESADHSDKITISLTNIPLIEALKYILTTKGLKYRIDDYAILVSTPERLQDVEMETRFYHLSTGAGDYVQFEESEAKRATGGGMQQVGEAVSGINKPKEFLTIKDVLEQSGVPFPTGSKIFLDKKTGTLLVRNTPSNLTLIEDILKTLDVSPFQITIQAKFIELSQTDGKELGFDWALKSSYSVLNNVGPNKKGNVSMSGQTTTTNSDGSVTKTGSVISGGERFIGSVPYGTFGSMTSAIDSATPSPAVTDSLFSFVGTLTDPEFSVVLRALSASGKANELSAPRVTTVNNQAAQIRVVKEYIYPSDYEATPPTTNEAGNIVTPGIVTPKSFVTRNIGIILDVTPSAGSDRKTIHMTIVPEVSELVAWIDYGVAYGTSKIPINQPLFQNRTLSTSVVVNDGDTVVLGGLMRDSGRATSDKVPFLGDLPVLGRLFRSETEIRMKSNLLIFVTADLMTPTGIEIRNSDMDTESKEA